MYAKVSKSKYTMQSTVLFGFTSLPFAADIQVGQVASEEWPYELREEPSIRPNLAGSSILTVMATTIIGRVLATCQITHGT